MQHRSHKANHARDWGFNFANPINLTTLKRPLLPIKRKLWTQSTLPYTWDSRSASSHPNRAPLTWDSWCAPAALPPPPFVRACSSAHECPLAARPRAPANRIYIKEFPCKTILKSHPHSWNVRNHRKRPRVNYEKSDHFLHNNWTWKFISWNMYTIRTEWIMIATFLRDIFFKSKAGTINWNPNAPICNHREAQLWLAIHIALVLPFLLSQ